MNIEFRKANIKELDNIWTIFKAAIQRRKQDGSKQWQDGYPNVEVLEDDIDASHGHVLLIDGIIAAYVAIMINAEPAYAEIEGRWLSNGDFVVFHRVAVSEDFVGRGVTNFLMDEIEKFARAHKINSLKADTNFDNAAMLRVFEKNGYVYCGEVKIRTLPRKAFEKVLLTT